MQEPWGRPRPVPGLAGLGFWFLFCFALGLQVPVPGVADGLGFVSWSVVLAGPRMLDNGHLGHLGWFSFRE